MTRKQPSKPSGKSEILQVSLPTKEITWIRFKLPSDKAEAERLVAHLFAKCLPDSEKAVAGILDLQPETIVKPLPERDHDFVILGTRQKWVVQLTEVVLVDSFRGDYDNAPHQFMYGEIADHVVERVLKKSKKYAPLNKMSNQRFVLLIYPSDQKFNFSKRIDPLITHYLKKVNNHHVFDRIYFMPIHSLERASPRMVYPGPPSALTKEQIDIMREGTTTIVTRRDMEEKEGYVEIKLPKS